MLQPITRALISVSDKSGLEELAKALQAQGVEILSTGGTARYLEQAGVPVTDVSAHTQFPEMMDGRLKTLHPKIHGGLLALRDHPEHAKAMQDHAIAPIDLVVVNLYPFEATVAKGAKPEEVIENIDIGGPSMVRSGAKNHRYVAVLVDPADYGAIIEKGGKTDLPLRQRLAAKAFARTAAYDAAISQWFATHLSIETPHWHSLGGTLKQPLRYGENPHQKAAFYVTDASLPGVASAHQLQGKELSFNNIHDTDAAFELVAEFTDPAVAIIKHANPCGVAFAHTLEDAYSKALASDPVSAFGGILACNRPLDGATAERMKELFVEVVIAPSFSEEAVALFAAKPNVRLLATGQMPVANRSGQVIKTVSGGFLVQERDALAVSPAACRVMTQKAPSETQLKEMRFAFTVVKHVKSNAIVITRDGATVGIGGGCTSRVDAVRNAVHQANTLLPDQRRSVGGILASDAFFPFADNIALAADAGIAAIIQPGGSVRDAEVIAAADKHGIAMVFTGTRHFKH